MDSVDSCNSTILLPKIASRIKRRSEQPSSLHQDQSNGNCTQGFGFFPIGISFKAIPQFGILEAAHPKSSACGGDRSDTVAAHGCHEEAMGVHQVPQAAGSGRWSHHQRRCEAGRSLWKVEGIHVRNADVDHQALELMKSRPAVRKAAGYFYLPGSAESEREITRWAAKPFL